MASHHPTAITGSNSLGQGSILDLSRQDNPVHSVEMHHGHISQGQYVDDVLKGASPLHIVDHGAGPFEDKTIHFQPSGFGVVCILNIPYNVTKSEIEHFLGRNASMIAHNEQGCSIHIIMERPTSKTMDCFVELLTPEAAVDSYNKHENSVMAGKHPRIGTRHVDLVISSQDQLLQAIFPRARGLVWENGVPRKTQNDDPYSAGFQGFFTREEMIGMYRHAETPQRSPFSVKCLQRTFECMISTLYKFPWHAQHMYTLEDRAQLFGCYMKQLSVLVYKVAEAQTVGLDTKLLIDFVSAGLNCSGFGERMRYMIAAHSGQVGASFPISQKSASWPFDVLSVPFVAVDGGRWWFEHADTLDFLVYLIQLGHDGCGDDYANSHWIETLPSGLPSDFDDQEVTSVRFKFREEVFNVSYDEIVSCETALMHQMLEIGFVKWQNNIKQAWNQGGFNQEMQKDVDCLARLQQWDQMIRSSTNRTPSESPKGTTSQDEEGYETTPPSDNTAFTSRHSRIDPTVEPFEPSFSRRHSEPPSRAELETIGTPLRAESLGDLQSPEPFGRGRGLSRGSSAVPICPPEETAISMGGSGTPAKKASIGTIGGHRPSPGRSPMGPKMHGRSFSVAPTARETIHEEDESEGAQLSDKEKEKETIFTGRLRSSTNKDF